MAPECLEITVRKAGLWEDAATSPNDKTTLSITVPVRLKRCGLGVRLIVNGPDEDKAAGPNPRLVALLVKANRWFAQLKSGQSPSVLAIAQEHGQATKEVTRVIYLAFLAPDIVQRIIKGEQPMGLGVKRLLSAAPLPLDWQEQRSLLGFTG